MLIMFLIVPGAPLGTLWLFLKACQLRERREHRLFHQRVNASHVPALDTLVIDGYTGRPIVPAR